MLSHAGPRTFENTLSATKRRVSRSRDQPDRGGELRASASWRQRHILSGWLGPRHRGSSSNTFARGRGCSSSSPLPSLSCPCRRYAWLRCAVASAWRSAIGGSFSSRCAALCVVWSSCLEYSSVKYAFACMAWARRCSNCADLASHAAAAATQPASSLSLALVKTWVRS